MERSYGAEGAGQRSLPQTHHRSAPLESKHYRPFNESRSVGKCSQVTTSGGECGDEEGTPPLQESAEAAMRARRDVQPQRRSIPALPQSEGFRTRRQCGRQGRPWPFAVVGHVGLGGFGGLLISLGIFAIWHFYGRGVAGASPATETILRRRMMCARGQPKFVSIAGSNSNRRLPN